MTRNRDIPLTAAVGALLICLLVCIGLIANSAFSKTNVDQRFQVYEQNYRIELSSMRRDYEMKIGRLQEQMISNDYTTRKRLDLMEDEQKKLKREIDDIRERTKAQR